MSVLRRGSIATRSADGAAVCGVTVQCPKCQERIIIAESRGNKPIRCAKCAYPLIRRSDLLLIAAACKKPASEAQAGRAVRILGWLADILPEAGTALGALANEHTLPISDMDRWNRLNSAYATGDENAREWLNRMCQSNPGIYKQGFCGNCGAPKYYVKNQTGKALCTYCQSAD